ncbi:N-acetylmuramoyl-L-alanine amidase [Listeria booriae]|uniref:N-acetylmuramoyl-L-alanine amidase n=1 Tax=Listeria booriae TaxID=1552123 RepID=UPI001C88EB74|nr:N-acetylmuramoyl-L-alanine amidase [Listeria booriae]
MTTYKVEKKLIEGLPKTALKGNNLIILHETANDKSTIDNEVSFMSRNWENAFVSHFVGGGGRVIQVAPVGYVQWGAGNANGYAYAQIELCRTKDEANFAKDYAVYCQLAVDLAKAAGIPATLDTGSKASDKGLKSHKWVADNLGGTTHQDPYAYLASWGITKAQFAADLAKAAGDATAPTPSKPQPSPQKPSAGGSIVDYLNSKGQNSSFAARKVLAAKHGIANYTGTAAQNTALLNKLKAGTPAPKPTAPKPSVNPFAGKKLVSKVNGLRFYAKPSWADKDVVGTVNKGVGFPTVLAKVNVNGSPQYKVQNSKGAIFYITASAKYVELKNK